MSAEIRAQLASAFEELVIEMQALDWWTLPRPSLAALASEQPFAADTMAFNQWLRWVFVERLQALLDSPESALPTRCSIEPMAEYMHQHELEKVAGLLTKLRRIDELLTRE